MSFVPGFLLFVTLFGSRSAVVAFASPNSVGISGALVDIGLSLMSSDCRWSVAGVCGLCASADFLDIGIAPSAFLKLAARLADGAATPPAVGKPSSARVVIQALYFIKGNRSLASSIDISFFSLLRLCGLCIVVISIGSPLSSC